MIGEPVELLASHHPGAEEMDAYERVLGDAMAGDATLFAREDYVEEAWRIVDPVLKAGHSRSTNTSLGRGDRGKSIRKFRRQEAGQIRSWKARRMECWSMGVLESWVKSVTPVFSQELR